MWVKWHKGKHQAVKEEEEEEKEEGGEQQQVMTNSLRDEETNKLCLIGSVA